MKKDKRSFMGGVKRVLTATMAIAMAAALLGGVERSQTKVVRAETVKPPTITQQEIKFKDLPRTHWAYPSVQWGVGKGLVKGYQDGTYRPSLQITEEEFVTVLSRYTKQQSEKTEYWSQQYYNSLAEYELPFKGNSDSVAKKTGLSRGQIARIIAAKNGFNLDERQAIYYMYENDISNGLIEGELSFESYKRDQSVNRAQIPVFFQRLEEKGHTTFKGKKSPVKDGSGIGGVAGVPKDTTVITDDDFNNLGGKPPKDNTDRKNPEYSGKFNTDTTKYFQEYKYIADKHGMALDGSSENAFTIGSGSNTVRLNKTKSSNVRQEYFVGDFVNSKNLFKDVLVHERNNKGTVQLTDAEIDNMFHIIENVYELPEILKISDRFSVRPIGPIKEGEIFLTIFANN